MKTIAAEGNQEPGARDGTYAKSPSSDDERGLSENSDETVLRLSLPFDDLKPGAKLEPIVKTAEEAGNVDPGSPLSTCYFEVFEAPFPTHPIVAKMEQAVHSWSGRSLITLSPSRGQGVATPRVGRRKGAKVGRILRRISLVTRT